MGCGASKKVVPFCDGRLLSKVAPVQDFSSIDAADKSFRGVLVNSENPTFVPNPPPTRKIQPTTPTTPALPPSVVVRDFVDLEQSELMMPKKSWDVKRHGETPGIPLPPDRQCHQEYLQELNNFCRYVKHCPSAVKKAVKLKRVIDAIRP
eukprot:symbB.v1.2.031699.t1/scaffold3709.1/size51634/3